jgi:hypothetical protein
MMNVALGCLETSQSNIEPWPYELPIFITFCWSCFVRHEDVVLRVIIKCSSFKGFCPLSTRWNDSCQFGCETIHIHLLTFCFLCHLLNCAPSQLTLSSIYNHKTTYENIFSKNKYGTIIHVIPSKCDNVINI